MCIQIAMLCGNALGPFILFKLKNINNQRFSYVNNNRSSCPPNSHYQILFASRARFTVSKSNLMCGKQRRLKWIAQSVGGWFDSLIHNMAPHKSQCSLVEPWPIFLVFRIFRIRSSAQQQQAWVIKMEEFRKSFFRKSLAPLLANSKSLGLLIDKMMFGSIGLLFCSSFRFIGIDSKSEIRKISIYTLYH